MSTIIGAISFVLVLGVIVLVHEFGHFIFAKLFGVYCGEFAIGMGPTLISKQGKETKYAIRAFPVGGFVAMAGENEDDEAFKDIPKERTIKGIAVYKRVIIMAAGATFNLILAWVLLFSVSVLSPIPNPNTNKIQVVKDSAASAYLQDQDRIIGLDINGKTIDVKNYAEVATALPSDGSPVTFKIERDGSMLSKTITPKLVTEGNESRYLYGISAMPFNETFGGNVKYANMKFVEFSQLIVQTLSKLITSPAQTSSNLSGPIGIYQVVNQAASQGIITLMFLTALLSVNIGIFNLLPIPILDGGRIVLEVISGITKKPISKKLESGLMYAGIALILLLLLVSTWNDIGRLISGFFG